MFKVGDRVRHTFPQINQEASVFKGDDGKLWVRFDNLVAGRKEYRLEGSPELHYYVLVSSTPTYKPGDKIVATCEHTTSNLHLSCTRARQGDVGVYVDHYPNAGVWQHSVKFDGIDYHCGDEHIAPYTGVTLRPTLSCARCHEPNQYAEPNLPGGGYACFSCRKYHAYALTGT